MVLIESTLPDLTGADLIRRLRPRLPAALFIVLTHDNPDTQIAAAIQAGAMGYVTKSDGPDLIFHAIYEALTRGVPLSRTVARDVLRTLRTSAPPFADK